MPSASRERREKSVSALLRLCCRAVRAVRRHGGPSCTFCGANRTKKAAADYAAAFLWVRPAKAGSASEIQPARAGSEAFELRAGDVRHGKQQVGCRLFILRDDVAVALQAAVRAADDDSRRVGAVVLIAVAHAAAPVEHRVIEQCAVAVFRVLQLLEEFGELDDLIGPDL